MRPIFTDGRGLIRPLGLTTALFLHPPPATTQHPLRLQYSQLCCECYIFVVIELTTLKRIILIERMERIKYVINERLSLFLYQNRF